MTDELARWAARRADDLIARAEAEVVAELKAALLRAAEAELRGETPAPAPRACGADPAPQVTEPSDDRELLWAYCVTRAAAPAPAGLSGLGGQVERIEHAGLAALVSRVPASEYGEDVLPGFLNDLERLEEVARSHETVLERAAERGTIVPLRLCTIFVDAAGVRRMLTRDQAALEQALARLDGREEWAVKLLLDEQPPEVEADVAAGGASSGTAYLVQRREERERRAASERLGRELAEDVHARLQDWAVDAVVNPPQNRELSGHAGEMLLNGAYLVEADRADELRRLVAELQEQHGAAGARLELTGPLPPFNFAMQP